MSRSGSWARALLYDGLDRYEHALAAAENASEHSDDLGASTWALPELIEAAVRSEHADLAARAFERLSETTRASGTPWAMGIEARSRALLSERDIAGDLYRKAITRLARWRVGLELARTHLFSSMGVEAFAERAARELLATGEKARKRTPDMPGKLTAQETQFAFTKLDIGSRIELGRVLPSAARDAQPV